MANIQPDAIDNGTISQPGSSGGGGVIQSAFSELAQGMDKLQQPFQRAALDQSEQEGQGAVYRDENGDLKYTERNPTSMMGAAFNRSARTSYLSQTSMDARVSVANLQAESGGDVDQFDKLSASYLKQVLGKQDPLMRGPVNTELNQIIGNSRTGLVQQQVTRDTTMQKNTISAQIGLLDDEAASLARTGGTGTPEYASKMDAIKTLQGEMVANPLFGYSQDMSDIAVKRMQADHMGNAVVGQVEDVFHKQGLQAATDFAQKAFLDPNLDLSMQERNQFKGVAMASVRGFKSDMLVSKQEAQGDALPLYDAMKNGQSVKDDDVYAVSQRLASAGDMKGSLALLRMQSIAKQTASFGSMSKEDQAATLAQGGNAVTSYADRVVGVESGGNANAQNPNSSAAGAGQFIDSTWLNMVKKYAPDVADGKSDADIIAMKSNKALSTQMVNAYGNENAAVLQAAGKDATPGNKYLAHVFGPDGALSLLNAPAGSSAGAILGDNVVKANPFLNGMSAQDAVNWAGKKMAGTNADPEVIKSMQSQVSSDAKTLWTSMKDGLKKGEPLADGDLITLGKELGAINDKDFSNEVMGTLQQTGQYSKMSLAAMDATMSAVQKNGIAVNERDGYEMMKSIHDQTVTGLANDPLDLAAKRGVIEPLKPLDFSNPTAVSKTLSDRQAAANRTAANYNLPNGVSALTGDEADKFAEQLKSGTPQQKGALLSALQGGLDDKTFMATLAKIAPSLPPAMTVAGGLFARNPAVGTSVMNGLDAIKATPTLVPTGDTEVKKETEDFNTNLPLSTFAGNAPYRNALTEAARARYADMSLAAGDAKGAYNPARMTQALNDVTGGLVSFNGNKIFPPRFGMGQDEFNTLAKNLGPQNFQNATTTSGQPVTYADVLKNGILKSFRDGQYLIQLGGKSAAGNIAAPYVMTADGKPFILDLTAQSLRKNSLDYGGSDGVSGVRISETTNTAMGADMAAGMMP